MKEKIYSILGKHKNKTTLCHFEIIKGKVVKVIMKAITKEEEIRIDNATKYYGEIRYIDENNIIIPAKNIYLYGEVDFNNEDDLENVENFDLIDKGENDNLMYCNFDYEKGTFKTINGYAKMHPTWDCIKWFKYCHVLIGKPKRIIVYKNIEIFKKK